MAENASRRGATDLGMPLMILAAVVLGGFFLWLYAQVQTERELAIVEDTIGMGAEREAREPAMAGAELQGDITALVGQEVTVEPLPVASLLGTQGFWVELPNRNPFLVSLSAQLRADSVTVAMGDRVGVTGTVQAVNDSVLTAWTEAGTITENDRIVAEFATHFIEATRLRRSTAGGTP